MIKMIALDLDNTLLNSDKKISSLNTKVLKKLHRQGLKVVLCTGRPLNAVLDYVDQLDLHEAADYTITFNGGLVLRNRDQQVLFQHGMSKPQLSALYQFAKQQQLPLDVLNFSQVYPVTDLVKSIYQQTLRATIKFVPTAWGQLSQQTYAKAIIATQPQQLDAVVARLSNELRHDYHIMRSQPKILEFLPPKVDKVYGLGALLSYFGWDFSNLLAFGDAENDAGMLRQAKIGVAMGNATPEIKQLADEETATNDQDGVALFLEKFMKR
ncbi:Hydrolase (HAD superfamily) [Fructilactobacillus florum 8D]|uniref:Hydrolase (HAD superfamily) n=1 Tax=Fructilactobacillus florum 8D TaxID=1221538 RepID=W9EF43_9LACO|nr:Cof-type HAD-IIB family hydrolase [Fructilactobacillus florum]ETO40697.1 Hydrolase (HAD superfamily) [Fructilactobacillus florum 8D]